MVSIWPVTQETITTECYAAKIIDSKVVKHSIVRVEIKIIFRLKSSFYVNFTAA